MAKRQFATDDTSIWGDRFGLGSNGAYTPSTSTDSPVDSACTGTINTILLSATNVSFDAGQLILIHQTRGTGAGQWELNKIASYSAGTITLSYSLIYGYVSGAQVLVMPQYSSASIAGGVTVLGKAWNETTGGIYAKLCLGEFSIAGTLNLNGGDGATTNFARPSGGGFIGGWSQDSVNSTGLQGESSLGGGVQSNAANGSGGGAGGGNANYNAGGGGGHATVGTAGSASDSTNGAAGGTVGVADLVTMVFGGAGGGATGIAGSTIRSGSNGGGIVLIIAKTITVSGNINSNGGGWNASNQRVVGGGGAGGSIYLKGQQVAVGVSRVTATGGVTTSSDIPQNAGDGGVGRVRIEYSQLISGTSSPTQSSVTDTVLNDLPNNQNYAFLM